jgi:hypothetical protein
VSAVTFGLPRSSPRGRNRWAWMTLLVAVAVAALAALLLAATRTSGAASGIDLGPGQQNLAVDITLTDLLQELANPGADDVFGVADTFADGFDTAGYEALTLQAGGTWLFDATTRTFTLAAIGEFANDTNPDTTFTVLLRAVDNPTAQGQPDPGTSLLVAIEVARAGGTVTLADVLPKLAKTAPGELNAPTLGLTTTQGTVDIDTTSLPAGAQTFLAGVLSANPLDTNVPVDPTNAVTLHGEVDPSAALLADLKTIGADANALGRLDGTVATTFAKYASFRTVQNTLQDLADGLALQMTLAPSVPAWTEPGWLSLADDPNDPDDPTPWSVDIFYNANQSFVTTSATGPVWDVKIPELFPNGATVSPSFLMTDQVDQMEKKSMLRVGGTIGDWSPPDNPQIVATVSLNFSKKGSDYVANFNADVQLDGDTTLNGDLFFTKSGSDKGLTVTLTASELLKLSDLAPILPPGSVPTSADVPSDFVDTSISQLALVLDVAGKDVTFGATGTVSFTPFGGSISSGISLMFFTELKANPKVMMGIAPSVQPSDPTKPVYLSELLESDVPEDFDFKVYDPDRPDTGFGVLYSSAQVRIGGEPCDVTGVDPCPVDKERTDVPVPVAQWLLPKYGWDGSDEAVADGTDPTGLACKICTFRQDFAPVTPIVVPNGLTVAASLVLPNPIGSTDDFRTVCQTNGNDSDACRDALGFLGQLSLDSKVQVSGTIPLNGSPQALGFGLTLRLRLMLDPPVARPQWLNDGELRLAMQVSNNKVGVQALGRLQLAIKQGFGPDEAEKLFPDDPQAIADNTLAPVSNAPGTPACPRGGVKLRERTGEGGFTTNEFYCHDLLNLTVLGELEVTPGEVSIGIGGDLLSVRKKDPNGPASLANSEPNPDAWQPAGLEKIAISQVGAQVKLNIGPTGVSAELNGNIALKILTTPPIDVSGAISLGFQPGIVTMNGFRVNIGQLSIANIVEIYEWISGEDVPTANLPGVSFRNLSLSIATQDVPFVCIKAGFFISGDLYVTDQADPTPGAAYTCDANPDSATYGQLSPSPEASCDAADIERGCVAGIRLLVNDRGVFGDAFIAEFDAGPVHIFDPDPNGATGRGVSITFSVTKLGISLEAFGAAAIGGTPEADDCALGQYCDAWASGDMRVQLKAKPVTGIDLRAFGRVRSGIPGLSFQVLVAGEAKIPGATGLVGLFRDGIIPDANFMLHVELTNTKAAPDLDFAAAAQAEAEAAFNKVLRTLNDVERVTNLLRTNPTEATKVLQKYLDEAKANGVTPDPALVGLIDTTIDIINGANEAGKVLDLDWLLNGFIFPSIPPGIPDYFGQQQGGYFPCTKPGSYGYGPSGSLYPVKAGYPYDYCFLYLTQDMKVPGLCDTLDIQASPCTLGDIAAEVLVKPMLDIVLAGTAVSTSLVEFAQDTTDLVLSGEIFRIDCASFDLSASLAGKIGQPDFKGALGFGLFVTLFGQPIGIAFEWTIDTTLDAGDQFVDNIERMGQSLLDAFNGTTESTCWSEEKIREFFELPPGPGSTPPPPPPATLASVSMRSTTNTSLPVNVAREGDTNRLTITFDRAVTADRTLTVTWGDGTSQQVVVPAGQAQVTVDKVYTDDNPTGTPVDLRTVSVRDASNTANPKTVSASVTLGNVAPSGVTVTPLYPQGETYIEENESIGLLVAFTDPGTLDTHRVRLDWGDGTQTLVDVPLGARQVSIPARLYLQNPISQIANVAATVIDDDSGVGNGQATISVRNVIPTVSSVALVDATPILESVSRSYRISWSDQGTKDGHIVLVKWGDRNVPFDEAWLINGNKLYDATKPITAATVGTPLTPGADGLVRSLTLAHTYVDDSPTGTIRDPYDISVVVLDTPDYGSGVLTQGIFVDDVAPVVNRNVAAQTRQYSDRIAPITITATDITGDPLTATLSAPAGLGISAAPTCTSDLPVPGRQTCTWTVSGAVAAGAGNYTIGVTVRDDDGLETTVTSALEVKQEDARVAFAATNPIDVRVAAPGGTSSPFTLRFDITETLPDLPAEWAAPGDIALAQVVVTLNPVGPGSAVTGLCTRTVTRVGSTPTYGDRLTITCPFSNVPVNTYFVKVDVVGSFYVGGDEDVVNVSDPSLGFTTGGGWFYWPGTTDKTTFGYTMKYTKRFTNVQGNLVMVRHLADGTSFRVKSNSISGLSVGKGTGFSWASFTGKNTYREPGWVDAVGNYSFTAYVEDRGAPGTTDRFWIEVKDKAGKVVQSVSVGRAATVGAVTLGGGNIVVPH